MTHATEAAPPVKKGVIHDIGYARYAGERLTMQAIFSLRGA